VVRSSDARADCGDRGPRPLVRHRVLRLFPLWAILRAAIQLSIVALLLRGVLAVPWTAAVFVLLMLSTASVTAMGRTRELWRGREAAAIGVAAGALVSLGAILALQLADPHARYLVATSGIIIGNAMSAATLSGRNFLRSARARASEVEAWLSLGATPAAHRDIGREAVRESLIVVLAGIALAMTVTAIVMTTIAGRSPYIVDTHS
jgi:putative ABC transport system permease protein